MATLPSFARIRLQAPPDPPERAAEAVNGHQGYEAAAALLRAAQADGRTLAPAPYAEDWGWAVDWLFEGARIGFGVTPDPDAPPEANAWLVMPIAPRSAFLSAARARKAAAEAEIIAVLERTFAKLGLDWRWDP